MGAITLVASDPVGVLRTMVYGWLIYGIGTYLLLFVRGATPLTLAPIYVRVIGIASMIGILVLLASSILSGASDHTLGSIFNQKSLLTSVRDADIPSVSHNLAAAAGADLPIVTADPSASLSGVEDTIMETGSVWQIHVAPLGSDATGSTSRVIPSPLPGTYDTARDITLSASDTSEISLTTDASEPSCDRIEYPTDAVVSGTPITIKARTCRDGVATDDRVETFTYETLHAPEVTANTPVTTTSGATDTPSDDTVTPSHASETLEVTSEIISRTHQTPEPTHAETETSTDTSDTESDTPSEDTTDCITRSRVRVPLGQSFIKDNKRWTCLADGKWKSEVVDN